MAQRARTYPALGCNSIRWDSAAGDPECGRRVMDLAKRTRTVANSAVP